MKHTAILVLLLGSALSFPAPSGAQRLFVGLEDATLPTRSSTLGGFPSVTWTNHFAFEVNGAACTPAGEIYLCNGPFSTRLYRAVLPNPPQFVTNVAVDVHGMGYGRGRLYGFANFASPMGIYEINPVTGAAALIIDTSGPGFRFFGLDYNPLDDKLYGYTEYGVGGLYAINIDSGAMTRLVSYPPGVGGQGRALAVGNNTVYLMATRGDEGEPCFAYDLAQGPGGSWVPFTNPYPANHNTGGATWIPAAGAAVGEGAESAAPGTSLRLAIAGPNPAAERAALAYELGVPGPARLEIFDVRGALVALLVDGRVDAGARAALWDGRDAGGARLPSGVYLARLSAGTAAAATKITLMR